MGSDKDVIDIIGRLFIKYGSIKSVCEETGLTEYIVRKYLHYDKLPELLKEAVDSGEIRQKTTEQISKKENKVICAIGFFSFTALIDMKLKPGAI